MPDTVNAFFNLLNYGNWLLGSNQYSLIAFATNYNNNSNNDDFIVVNAGARYGVNNYGIVGKNIGFEEAVYTSDTGITTTQIGTDISTTIADGGVVNEQIGLNIQNVEGASINYAIKTGTGKVSFGDITSAGNTTGNTTIGSEGIMLYGTATQYDDIVFPLIGGTTPATNPPSLTQFKNGTYAYAFGNKIANQESQLFATLQMSHSYKLGTDIDCHIHWACGGSATTTNNVTWALEVTKADIGGVFGNAVTYRVNQSCGTAYTHNLADWHSIGNFTGLSGVAQMRVYRDSAYVGDSYTGDDAFGLSLDCHYEKDSLGSRQEYVK